MKRPSNKRASMADEKPSEEDLEMCKILLSLYTPRTTLPPHPTAEIPPRVPHPTAEIPPRPQRTGPRAPRRRAGLPPRVPNPTAEIQPRRPQATAEAAPRAQLKWEGKRARTQQHYRRAKKCKSPSTPLDYGSGSGSGSGSDSGSGSGPDSPPMFGSGSDGQVIGWVPSARRPRSQRGAKIKFSVQAIEPMKLDYGVATQEHTAKRLKKSVRAEVPDLNYPPPSQP